MSFFSKIMHGADRVAEIMNSPAAKIALSLVPGGAAVNTILGAIIAVEHAGLPREAKKSSVLAALQVAHPGLSQARLSLVVDEIVGAMNHGSPQEIQTTLSRLAKEFEDAETP